MFVFYVCFTPTNKVACPLFFSRRLVPDPAGGYKPDEFGEPYPPDNFNPMPPDIFGPPTYKHRGYATADAVIYDCLKKHEERHARGKRSSCKGIADGRKPGYGNIPKKRKDIREWGAANLHCSIYLREVRCLKKGKKNCDSLSPAEKQMCIEKIDTRIQSMNDWFDKNCVNRKKPFPEKICPPGTYKPLWPLK